MSYSAEVFNVMIASPGDVASERAIIREVIYEWNAVNSPSKSIVLLPVGWESHSSPEMGGSAQQIINEQILDKCDLLVGVFWTRIGSATTEYASGTVEEIERHIDSKKPAMLYFSSQPVAMDSVDLEQFQNLKQFKSSCQRKGLYESYDNRTDFKEKFYRQLQLKINDHELFKGILTTAVVKSDIPLPALTDDASILLKEASLDSNGNILCLNYLGGKEIQTNGRNFIVSGESREVAKWESALKELVDIGYLVARGNKGELFDITNLGYQIADMTEL